MLEFLGAVVAWLVDPGHWQGRDAIQLRIVEHLALSGVAVVAASAVALPLGLFIGHTGRGAFGVISVANIGRAVPSIAMISLALIATTRLLPEGYGLGFWPTAIALVFLAVPPIVANAHVGIREVDADLVDAARGIGMSELEIVRRVEIPIALPVILAGLRTASVQVVATATLAALVAWGGLGRYIIDGFAQGNYAMAGSGAILVASLAILTEVALAFLQRTVTPRTASAGRRRLPGPAETAQGGTRRGGTTGF